MAADKVKFELSPSSAIVADPEEISAGFDPLRDVDTVVFDAFVDWLYKGSVPKSLHTTLMASPHKNAPISIQWPLYILADLLSANELKWAIFKMVFTNYAESDNVPEIALVVYLSKHLTTDDVMLRLLSDVLCINDGILVWQRVPQEEFYDVPNAFFIRALYKRNTMNDFSEKDEKAVLQLEDYDLEPPKEIVFWK
ncbi:hypothetical protein J1614_004135 [Plenodomus biglobosus]|nr:hypothetical protein J1614_004135 [Plenodomus biglobosus]